MPRLAIYSRDLHWHWINRTLLCDTMEVSMLSRAWLTIAQHVFQPALTGRPELISRKIVSGEPGTKAIAVSRFREKLSPANWVQGVTAISRKISRSWAPKKWGPTCDRDISNSAIYTTAIYRAYTVPGGTQVIAQSLKTRQQNGPKLEILQSVINTFDYWYFIIMAHMRKKKSVVTKTTSPTRKWSFLFRYHDKH